jgi:hypothetical protein
VAPALVAHQQELARSMSKDKLAALMRKRPAADELQAAGILPGAAQCIHIYPCCAFFASVIVVDVKDLHCNTLLPLKRQCLLQAGHARNMTC